MKTLKFLLFSFTALLGINCTLSLKAGDDFRSNDRVDRLDSGDDQNVVLVPESSGWTQRDSATGRVHTRMRLLQVPNAMRKASVSPFNTPATMRAAYNLPSTGGSNAIAIVDAYHFPTALADFNSFSTQFGLPTESSANPLGANSVFQVVYANGTKPQSGGNYISSWNLEEALDIEWAHAMAPGAKIYLVEAASDNGNDLYAAVRVAASLPGVKEVSMSWGGSEMSYEAMFFDPVFTNPGVVYFASGGDSAAQMEYPAASPNVVSCGGTSIKRNSTTGAVSSETGWSDTGCGPSAYEPRPAYQNAVASTVGNKRGVSDLSYVADPNTGVYVYDSTPVWGQTGWFILGGTSVSSPALAGVINLAATAGNGFAASSVAENTRIYSNLGNTAAFRDIVSGKAGRWTCKIGYDYLTGVGVPNGLAGK